MPQIYGVQTSQIRDVNVALATTFFPRFLKSVWQQVCGSTLSTALVEPFALDGASPLLMQYNGRMQSRATGSWSLQVPNLLFKNIEKINRTDLEMDQTGTLLRRTAQIGIRVAQLADYLFAKRILSGSLASSATVLFGNTTYYTTFENGIPFFSTAHNSYSSQTQSNIIQGGLPTTMAAVQADNLAVTANTMQQDIANLIGQIGGLLDDKGAQVYPDFDPMQHLIIMVPPGLRTAAMLAFTTPGATIGGSNGSNGSSGATTSIGPMMVKKVISWNLLQGCTDVESQTNAFIYPTNQTCYYAFIDNDLVRPFYFQRFRPKQAGEYSPVGSNPQAMADAAIKAAGGKISPEAADIYSSLEVDTNISALGSNAQASVVEGEEFFISGRTRANFVYGPWFTGFKIDPQGQSN